jgi:O-succinylbenzoic acid--CoA ligase
VVTTPVVRVATHDTETVAVIGAALDARRPIALIHAKLTESEIVRQRGLVERAELGGDDDAVVLFTSGSTGSARGVVLSRAAIEAAARASWERLGVERGDRWWCPLSFAHAGGLSILVRCRVAGVEMSLVPEGATLASLVPTMLADVGAALPRTLRAVLLGGAAAPPGLVADAVARGVPVLPTYGLTETFGQIATARVPGGPLVALAGVEIAGGTRDVPARLRVRGPMLATRYLDGAPIAPAFTTADLGFVEDGVLHVVGRADDVIVTGGENVHPAQVEAVVAATPGVRHAVAFGVADERWGQIVAVAVEADGPVEVARWHAALPPHARPRRMHVARALPRLANGKLDRRAIATLPTSPIDYAC